LATSLSTTRYTPYNQALEVGEGKEHHERDRKTRIAEQPEKEKRGKRVHEKARAEAIKESMGRRGIARRVGDAK
jgi:hypothetical protein